MYDIHSVEEFLKTEQDVDDWTKKVNNLIEIEKNARISLITAAADLQMAKNTLDQLKGLRDSKKKVLTILPKN